MINWLHNGTYDDDWVVACDEMHINECLTSVVCVFLMHLQCTFFFLLSFRSLCISFHFGLSAYLCRKRQRIAVEETNVLVAASGGGGVCVRVRVVPVAAQRPPNSPYLYFTVYTYTDAWPNRIATCFLVAVHCAARAPLLNNLRAS